MALIMLVVLSLAATFLSPIVTVVHLSSGLYAIYRLVNYFPLDVAFPCGLRLASISFFF